MKILVVDDSITMQRLIAKVLKEVGYTDITICKSAKEALESLQSELPRLILLDWHMPEMNGFELLKKLKNNEQYKSIPVIMLTVEDEMENVSKAIDHGAEGYILKPINKDLLLTRLKDIEDNKTLGLNY